MTNKYPGPCAYCHQHVEAGAGQALRNGDGRWHVYCNAHAGQRQPAQPLAPEAQAGPQRRELTESGIVRTPYEPANLPLVRAFPGARFDGDSKTWRVSVGSADVSIPSDWKRYEKLTERDVCGEGEEVTFTAERMTEVSAGLWQEVKRFFERLPNAGVYARRHEGHCNCDEHLPVVRYGIMVVASYAGQEFRREYAVPE